MKNILDSDLYQKDLKRIGKNFSFDFLKNKTILITGGLGLIGSAIVDLIHSLTLGTTIMIADINESYFVNRYKQFDDIKFIFYNALENFNFDFDCDYIIHCAGIASPDLYIEKPVETMLSNIKGLTNILFYAKNSNVQRVLFVSSSEVYGIKNYNESFSEELLGISNIDNCRCSYSESKRACEVLCQSFTKEYGINTIIVRPGHVFGPTASLKDKRIASDFLFKASRGEKLVMKSAGLQKRSYCYSLDCAASILIALSKGQPGQAYNIGHDEMTSVIELAKLIAKYGGVDLSYSEPSDAEKEAFNPMDNSCLSIKKIKKIGYRDSFSVAEAISHSLSIIKFING